MSVPKITVPKILYETPQKIVDREVDLKLYDKNLREYRCEVKLIGKGNKNQLPCGKFFGWN